MLLRYATLHGGVPQTDVDWLAYAEWKKRQMALKECQMALTEGTPDPTLKCDETCRLYGPGCPKYPLKKKE